MSGERWRERVRKAWQEVDEVHGRSEAEVLDAGENFWRALFNRPPVPDAVRAARIAFKRHLEDWMEDGYPNDPVQQAVHQDLMRQVTDAECAAGIHAFCAHRRDREQPDAVPPDDEDPVTGDWFDARRAQVWGVIQPDGSVVAKGFVGDDTADEDQAVHPAGSLAYYSPERGWTNAATGHPAAGGAAPDRQLTDEQRQARAELREAERAHPGQLVCVLCRKVPCRCVECPQCGMSRVPGKPCRCDADKRPDLADLRRGPWFDTHPITTTSSAGGDMASIGDARAGIAAANEKANEGLGALQQALASLEQAQGTLMQATEGSGQADVSEANGLLAQAVGSIDEVRQQVSAAISASQGVAGRL